MATLIRFFHEALKYWYTIRYLKPAQIVNRVLLRFKNIKIDLSPPVGRQREVNKFLKPAERIQSMYGDRLFCFLNEQHSVENEGDWNNEKLAKLWLYNLHYFDDLNAIESSQRREWHRRLIQNWIDSNPVYSGNGWEPYPSSLRIVNWIKWSLAGNDMNAAWLYSLTLQVRYLSKNMETHLLGNHLFANAKALLFSGLFFSGKEADSWYRAGIKIILAELPEQVLDDGGNFELSTMYHMIFLEDLLDIVNVLRAYDHEVPADLELVIPRMTRWLAAMCHPDGEIGFFNDAAIGITPSVTGIFEYSERLGYACSSIDEVLTDLNESGYTRIQTVDAVILIDRAAVGPDYLPGHAHADTLSFEMSLFGQRVVVNSGTSVYGSGSDRQYQRSTSAHSTVVLDSMNSSEVWGGFRVARRARVCAKKIFSSEPVVVSGCHDGYMRLSGKPVHCRRWQMDDTVLTVDDKITGSGVHKIEIVFHLHPEVVIDQVFEDWAIIFIGSQRVEVRCDGCGILKIEDSSYYPGFGLTVGSKKLVYYIDCILPVESSVRFIW